MKKIDVTTVTTIKECAKAIIDDINDAQKNHRKIPLHRISKWAGSIRDLAEQQIRFLDWE